MDAFANAFSALPYFDTGSMYTNMSSRCATKRLLQLRAMGLFTIAEPVESKQDRLQMDEHGFKQGLDAMRALEQTAFGRTGYDRQWRLFLAGWQAAEPCPSSPVHEGCLAFTDPTTLHYVVLRCTKGRPTAAMQAQATAAAQQLLCIATYVGYDPKWVRAGVYSSAGWLTAPALPDGLLSEDDTFSAPSFVTITPDNCQPSLSAAEVAAIDGVVSASSSFNKYVADYRRKAGQEQQDLRHRVLQVPGGAASHGAVQGTAAAAVEAAGQDVARRDQDVGSRSRSSSGSRHTAAPTKVCGWCKSTAEQADVEALKRCSGCHTTYYCSVTCQKAHRPAHKAACRAASAARNAH